MWHFALTFLFVPKYQSSTCDILALAHCSLIGAPVKLKHREMSKCQTSRAALQPKVNTALFLFQTLRLLRLFLLPTLGSLLPQHQGKKKKKTALKGRGRWKEREKGRRRSQTRTFRFRNTLNEYLVVQSNYRLVGKYGPMELQKIHIIDPVL